jgi:hypothetical protein
MNRKQPQPLAERNARIIERLLKEGQDMSVATAMIARPEPSPAPPPPPAKR